MAPSDDEIDDLYRRPLDQFTAARNTLAKTRGAEGASIKALEKPNVAAWGVNQLYWHGREHYDRLVKASEESREAHRNVLAGRPADVRLTEKAHREAIREAAEKIRELLASGGQATTAQTMTAVAETLEALPTDDPPGRLTRPLKPLGFAALSGVPVRATSAEKPQRATMKLVETKADPAAEQRNEERARRQAEEEREQLRAAQKEAREAEVTEQRARAAVEKAEREVERRTTALDEATETLRRLQKELKDATVAYQRARLRARL
jgi:DNA repair exonuclease SbcCD ATPase subunit